MKVFWLFLPAGIANMSPVLFRWIPVGSYPIDLGIKFRGRFLIGPHKTYRGLFVGIASAIFIVYLQKVLYPITMPYSLIDYSQANFFVLGFLLGAGALFGDIIKSFFKRRFNIPPGKPWVPFDQIDWIAGAILASSLVVKLNFEIIFVALIMFGLLHPVINLFGYYLKIKKNKF